MDLSVEDHRGGKLSALQTHIRAGKCLFSKWWKRLHTGPVPQRDFDPTPEDTRMVQIPPFPILTHTRAPGDAAVGKGALTASAPGQHSPKQLEKSSPWLRQGSAAGSISPFPGWHRGDLGQSPPTGSCLCQTPGTALLLPSASSTSNC